MDVLPKLYQAVLFYVLGASHDRTSCESCKVFGNGGVKRLKVPL